MMSINEPRHVHMQGTSSTDNNTAALADHLHTQLVASTQSLHFTTVRLVPWACMLRKRCI